MQVYKIKFRIPLEKRVNSKNSNIKKKAFSDIKQLLNNKTKNKENISELKYFIKPALEDKNFASQLSGLESVLLYVQNDKLTEEDITTFIPIIVLNVFNSTKDSICNKGVEIVNLLSDDESSYKNILSLLQIGFSQRAPKISISTMKCYMHILSKYGPKKVPMDLYYEGICTLQKLTNVTVKKETKNFICDIYLYVRDDIKPCLNKADSSLYPELEPRFNSIKSEPLPDVCGKYKYFIIIREEDIDNLPYDEIPSKNLIKEMKDGEYYKKVYLIKYLD